MPLTADQFAQLSDVNRAVNAIPYDATMGPTEPVDYWTYEPEQGVSWVCRDSVEDKAERLRQAGWPPTNLTVILCWTEPLGNPPTREYHAVLGVYGAGETYVLDSRIDEPYPMANPPPPANRYQWDRRQIAGTTDFAACPIG